MSTCQQHAESLAVVLQLDKAPAFPGPTRPWDKGYPHRASGDARPSSAGVPASQLTTRLAVAFSLNSAAFAVSGPTWLDFVAKNDPKSTSHNTRLSGVVGCSSARENQTSSTCGVLLVSRSRLLGFSGVTCLKTVSRMADSFRLIELAEFASLQLVCHGTITCITAWDDDAGSPPACSLLVYPLAPPR